MASNSSIVKSLSCYICYLDASRAFERLSTQEKLYAHYMARAAWNGSRIIMRQVSPESQYIFDFILETYRACDGNWELLAESVSVGDEAVEGFLDYAAVFLANLGNYYGKGDQKFVPAISLGDLKKIGSISNRAKELHQILGASIYQIPPYNLGFPSDTAQSAYYPGDQQISKDEIGKVSRILEQKGIFPENTRIQKLPNDSKKIIFHVLKASVGKDENPIPLFLGGDFEKQTISKYIQSFTTGSMDAYKDSQISWVQDKKPAVETVIGFVEPYRDPYGIRAEFESLVGIVDPDETKVLTTLTAESTKFIRRLPWTIGYSEDENKGKGPFEKDLFEPPDFTSLQVLAYCSSIIFLGINLPNFNDIRQDEGFKNVLISNRQKLIPNPPSVSLLERCEIEAFDAHKIAAWRIQIIIHELFGHGTSKLLTETAPGQYNFDFEHPPISPLTGQPITTWYRPGQTWTGVFGGLATTLDECRAECVGSYLMADKDLLAIFGCTDESEIKAEELTYNIYLSLGVIGLQSLKNYVIETKKWGQAHDRAHFAMFRTLLAADNGNFMTVSHDVETERLTVRIDRSKILSHGRPAIGELAMELHIYRCTADVDQCREFYEELTRVDGIFLTYRDLVLKKKSLRDSFVQANTVVVDGIVELREYEPTTRGVVRSWAERGV